ncbi:POU domain, class 2, transcription factor 1, variant 3 [Dermatophagoides farinae]|uniref:POU domain, class 2, transcription factor 1, variant 3 n=1 Tax=Dermatophagoides farinae TaxID=6954 RepID=A0A922I912_DERFA|nr:POU domain, class 2, transcription factor 1, variant 3 [Dermatophagoides farinae]
MTKKKRDWWSNKNQLRSSIEIDCGDNFFFSGLIQDTHYTLEAVMLDLSLFNLNNINNNNNMVEIVSKCEFHIPPKT